MKDGRLDKAAYTTWALKLGIDEKAAGIAFDTYDHDGDSYLSTVEQSMAWSSLLPIWKEEIKR